MVQLERLSFGSAWGIAMDGELQFAGEVTMETVNNFAWSFGQAESCAEALASHSILVDIENECSPPASLLQEVVVNEEPVADFALAADSCAVVQFTLGEDVFCPDLFDVLWSISEIEGSVEPETLAGSASSNFWTTSSFPENTLHPFRSAQKHVDTTWTLCHFASKCHPH